MGGFHCERHRLATRWLRLSRDVYHVVALKSVARKARGCGGKLVAVVYIFGTYLARGNKGFSEQVARVHHTSSLSSR